MLEMVQEFLMEIKSNLPQVQLLPQFQPMKLLVLLEQQQWLVEM